MRVITGAKCKHGRIDNISKFFTWLHQHMNYQDMDDWYKLSVEDISKNGGGGLLRRYYQSSLVQALINIYPEHNWQMEKFIKQKHGGMSH